MFGKEAPSTRFRWLAFESMLAGAGWKVTYLLLGELKSFEVLATYDVVVLQKTMVSRRLFKKIRRHAKKLVYDADDRIWLRAGRPYRGWTRWKVENRMRAIAMQSDLCLAANTHIAQDLKAFGADSQVVPMALDANVWFYTAPREKFPVIGWTGGPKNLVFLETVLPALRAVAQKYQCPIHIHCGKDPEFPELPYTYIPYVEGKESDAVRQFDIGLCPLPDDPFACGKSPVKSLQYLASGAAIIASPYGAIQDILMNGETGLWAEGLTEWESQLERLVSDTCLRHSLAKRGREQWEESFSMSVVFERLNQALSL